MAPVRTIIAGTLGRMLPRCQQQSCVLRRGGRVAVRSVRTSRRRRTSRACTARGGARGGSGRWRPDPAAARPANSNVLASARRRQRNRFGIRQSAAARTKSSSSSGSISASASTHPAPPSPSGSSNSSPAAVPLVVAVSRPRSTCAACATRDSSPPQPCLLYLWTRQMLASASPTAVGSLASYAALPASSSRSISRRAASGPTIDSSRSSSAALAVCSSSLAAALAALSISSPSRPVLLALAGGQAAERGSVTAAATERRPSRRGLRSSQYSRPQPCLQ